MPRCVVRRATFLITSPNANSTINGTFGHGKFLNGNEYVIVYILYIVIGTVGCLGHLRTKDRGC
ncbi:hypothetical protein BDN70DRAFT_358415 [Pholiota conissans]|uniref:Uncharacterized protein n=1 Tax=Pholiota conissans TaxID=109636 RepID=A0A9P5Z9E6_9AGAR|nr:hypothetical protein BDN70DRAFT_358415 [Pholiota conissans]